MAAGQCAWQGENITRSGLPRSTAPRCSSRRHSAAAARTLPPGTGTGAGRRRGRPERLPCVLARWRPAWIRSLMRSRSNCAKLPRIPSISRPVGEECRCSRRCSASCGREGNDARARCRTEIRWARVTGPGAPGRTPGRRRATHLGTLPRLPLRTGGKQGRHLFLNGERSRRAVP